MLQQESNIEPWTLVPCVRPLGQRGEWHWGAENPYLATYLKTTSQAKEPQETLYGPLRTPSIENNIFASSPPPLVGHPPPHAPLSIFLPPDSPATINVD